jgi:hypothetical protein
LGLTDYRSAWPFLFYFNSYSRSRFPVALVSFLALTFWLWFLCNILIQHHYLTYYELANNRTFVGTNLCPLWEKFLVPSEGNLEARISRCPSHSFLCGTRPFCIFNVKKSVTLWIICFFHCSSL